MTRANRWHLVTVFSCLGIFCVHAQTIDTVLFGNDTSEKSHSLTAYFSTPTDPKQIYWKPEIPAPTDPSVTGPSEVISGALGQTARRLLPRTPEGDVYGGQMTFAMAVDSTRQNYFTIKLWGSDPNGGNLLLDCNGKEIGGRHGAAGLGEDPLYFAGTDWFPGRFIYRTEPLPLSMTYRKSSVTITIRSLGGMFDYAPIFTYVPEYQHIMTSPSPSIYTAYTHVGSVVDISGEAQGTAPPISTPRTLEDDDSGVARARQNVNARLASLLEKPGSGLALGEAFFLAQCYNAKKKAGATWIDYPTGKTEADLGKQIVAALDAIALKYETTPAVATDGWGGALGDMGNTMRLSWPLISSSISGPIDSLGSTRQSAWSAALRASVDSGRFHRQNIANQAMDNAMTIYLANRGLLLVDPANALKEEEARRYLKESIGILPWMGDDQPGDGPVPVHGLAPYGPNWYMCTTKGTTKDGDGFVGSDYGELGPWIYKLGVWAGDADIAARGITMTRARDYFRYPGADDKGFLIMEGTDPIGVRNNDLPSHYVYLGRGFADDFFMASQGAGVIGKDLLGYFQEGMNDGQMARNIWDDPYVPGEYTAIKAMPATNVKLPMAIGQPDFAWVDEENMVVSARHGEERFFANLYWRQPGFINGLAKVFHLTPTVAHLGDVMVDDVRFRSSGLTRITERKVDGFTEPPDKPAAAFSDLPVLVAFRSDLTAVPAQNRDAGRGTGYTFRYGNWLVGINADHHASYSLSLPAGVDSATDLVSGSVKTGEVILAPKTSVVFYLPANAAHTALPSRTLYIGAAGGASLATVIWNPAGGAASYAVLRSTTSGGPYTTIATGVTDCSYTDKTAAHGTYYYVVASVNAAGASGYSPEASATTIAPVTAGLIAPWGDANLGVDSNGSESFTGNSITLTSGLGGITGTADRMHFLYQPIPGSGIITARVQSQVGTNANTKAGLMIRASLDPGSPFAGIYVNPGGTVGFQQRGSLSADSSNVGSISGLPAPCWVRLVLSGIGVVTGYASADGKTWQEVGTCAIPGLPRVAYAGLVSSPEAYLPPQSNVATFTDVVMPLSAGKAPLAPASLTGIGGNTSATLTWSGDNGAEVFSVKRATSAAGPFTPVASGVAESSYTDYGLVNGTPYYYRVSSVNPAGESADSAVATVQPSQLPLAVAGLSAKSMSGQVSLSWLAQPGATSYVVRRASGRWLLYNIVASNLASPTYTDKGLKDGTVYSYQVAAVNGGGEGPLSVTNVLPPGGLPDEWQNVDIGQAQPGGAYFTAETFRVFGGGSDIWNNSDSFHYVYQAIKGDCKITARVTEIQKTSDWAKVGVMFRNTLDANSAYAAVYVTPGNGVSSQYRSTTGANAAIQTTNAGFTAPYGVRIVRSGTTFSYYCSDDGSNWTPMGTTTIAMGETIYVGLAACSAKADTLTKANLDHVTVAKPSPDQ